MTGLGTLEIYGSHLSDGISRLTRLHTLGIHGTNYVSIFMLTRLHTLHLTKSPPSVYESLFMLTRLHTLYLSAATRGNYSRISRLPLLRALTFNNGETLAPLQYTELAARGVYIDSTYAYP